MFIHIRMITAKRCQRRQADLRHKINCDRDQNIEGRGDRAVAFPGADAPQCLRSAIADSKEPRLVVSEDTPSCKMVLPLRIELRTSPLPRECSTTELRQRRFGGLPGQRAANVHA